MFDLISPTRQQVLPLFRGLHAYHVAHLPGVFHAEGTDAVFLQHLAEMEEAGAVLFGHDAGWGMVSYLLAIPQIRSENPLLRARKRLWVDHLYVAPGFRGKGLARGLILHLESWMVTQGIHEWAVSHHAFNTGAGRMYEGLGAQTVVAVRSKTLAACAVRSAAAQR
jgi:aminoglycoside 6'-N-acetyltransferase I